MRILITILLIPVGALLFVSCGGSEATKPEAAFRPVQVGVIAAHNESVPAFLEAPGTVQPRDRIALSSQINGFVKAVLVQAGDVVSAGQLLVTLDSRDAESQKAMATAGIDEAQAALAEARKGAEMAKSMQAAAKAAADLAGETYGRYQKLFAARSVSPQELDEVRARRDGAAADLAAKEAMAAAAQDRLRQVEAKIAQADAQSRRADVYLGWTTVKAPSAGRVVERSVDPGSAIFPGSPLITVESASRPRVLASLPTAESGGLHNGLEVRVTLPDRPEISASGRVSEIIPLSSQSSHTLQFKLDLPSDFPAVSGTFVKVEIPAGTRQALLVPGHALRVVGQLTGVFVADSASRARFRLVKSTAYDNDRAELLSGIAQGERVVVNLTDQITDGALLEIR